MQPGVLSTSSLDVKFLTIIPSHLTSKFYSLFVAKQYTCKFILCFDSISLVFGIVTIASGLLGVVSGSIMGQKLRIRFPSAGKIDELVLFLKTRMSYIFNVPFFPIFRCNHLRYRDDLQRALLLCPLGPIFGIHLRHLRSCLPCALVY